MNNECIKHEVLPSITRGATLGNNEKLKTKSEKLKVENHVLMC
jgi:hypothetical protein